MASKVWRKESYLRDRIRYHEQKALAENRLEFLSRGTADRLGMLYDSADIHRQNASLHSLKAKWWGDLLLALLEERESRLVGA